MHYYTVEQANAKLPEVRRLLEEMQAQSRQLAALQGRLDMLRKKAQSNGHHNPGEDLLVAQASEGVQDALRASIQKLADWNIELKDLERGLIDFPALREGRVVFLCWEFGEPEVAFWHETTSGYAGRRPLDDKLP